LEGESESGQTAEVAGQGSTAPGGESEQTEQESAANQTEPEVPAAAEEPATPSDAAEVVPPMIHPSVLETDLAGDQHEDRFIIQDILGELLEDNY
jgi:hypothetical protein